MLQVVIADDHRLVRRGLKRLLNTAGDIAVVGEASDGAEALAQTRALKPDILLLDLNMDDMDGFEVLGRLNGASAPRVIVVSMHTGRDLIRRALNAGAVGYVSKRAAAEELIAAVREVGGGGSYLCTRVRKTLLGG